MKFVQKFQNRRIYDLDIEEEYTSSTGWGGEKKTPSSLKAVWINH